MWTVCQNIMHTKVDFNKTQTAAMVLNWNTETWDITILKSDCIF